MWIERDIEELLKKNHDVIQIIRGPRQCGKSSLIYRLSEGFEEVSLDDIGLRELAQSDPELFLRQFAGKKLFIDEAQYAPNLFPALKRAADLFKRAQIEKGEKVYTIFRLTGSNQILLDREVKESLAGRASFFDMNTLSVSEITSAGSTSIQNILYRGGFPEIYRDETIDARKYLDDYINSYIEKDIVLTAGIQKSREFLIFLRLLAGRVGQILEFSAFSKEVGVDNKTIKEWTSILEKMQVISLARAYSSNLSKRLIKSPKIYFIDTGLACRLQGWSSPRPIITSPQQGHLFENLVYSELLKLLQNYQLGWEIFHWRSKDGEEIDFLIKKGPDEFIFMEVKVSVQKLSRIEKFSEVKKVFKNKTPKYFHCHQEGERIFNGNVPIALLKDFLLS